MDFTAEGEDLGGSSGHGDVDQFLGDDKDFSNGFPSMDDFCGSFGGRFQVGLAGGGGNFDDIAQLAIDLNGDFQWQREGEVPESCGETFVTSRGRLLFK